VSATATDYGTDTLHVKAVDATLNEGNGQTSFDVAEPSRPAARWALETTPSVRRALRWPTRNRPRSATRRSPPRR
jgi:hypothetical protein